MGATGTFDPALFGGAGRQAFTLTSTAFDAFDNPLGKTRLALFVEEAATVSIGIQRWGVL